MTNWETERLLLRPLTLDDLGALYQLYREPMLMQYVTGQPRSYEKTRERLLSHLMDFDRHGFGYYATILKATGEMIGRCGIQPMPKDTGLEGALAWMFSSAYWNQGLATEFARAMIPYGFTHFPLDRIYAQADIRNPASIRVMQKVGLHMINCDEQYIEYEISRSDFEANKHQ
ncbi:GNAT family N-acetyltransferase [Dictyobacter kobayashii]|uniref:N-acetyltransferase n=1 Tax=Dictyobacter kobayashii TaxID=2014872 RepID=A0A402ARR9_9CHLR|nr:GNAT family N-acetyltransferase [Dictyobacter kobayashii]GCE21796.1 N-acetyltransferase [Dictyobacter kobayashii]